MCIIVAVSEMSGNSSYCSPLFMSDPLSGDDLDMYIVKGNNDKNKKNTPPVTVVSDGMQDCYIVENNGTSYRIDRQALSEAIRELRGYATIPTALLSPAQKEAFQSVVQTLNITRSNTTVHGAIEAEINDVFADLTQVLPGTVGAFFHGCNVAKDPRLLSCDPKCAGSPIRGADGLEDCRYTVAIYADGSFTSLNDVTSDTAYIYIKGNSFAGFTDDDINRLRSAGIKRVVLILGGDDGRYTRISELKDINQLPMRNGATMVPQQNGGTPPAATTSSMNGWVIFAIIVVVVILIILIIVAVQKSRGTRNA